MKCQVCGKTASKAFKNGKRMCQRCYYSNRRPPRTKSSMQEIYEKWIKGDF